jgi:hypothetical protein
MKRRIRLLAWMVPSVGILFACSLSQVAQNAEGTVAVIAQTALPTSGIAGTTAATVEAAAASSGSELFKDDFSNTSSGWDKLTDDAGTTDYLNGKYEITVADTSSYLFANPSTLADTTDVSIGVDVLKSNDIQHDMGIICRYVDSDNFYYFMVSSDGYFSIGKFKDGNEERIGSTDMRQDNAGIINTGTADNHLRADCVGDTLTLYANGVQLFQTQDSDFAKGNVGLIAGSYDTAPVTVYFDNFVVTQP